MAGYTAISNGETGASVRGKINTQMTELFGENAKAIVTVANAAALAAIPTEYVATGKIVQQLDTGVFYQWSGSAWAVKTGPLTATTLATSGAATLASAGVTGAATVGGTLGVTGASTLASVGVTGAATVGGTLGVTGASTLASVGVTNNADVGGDLVVTGQAEAGTFVTSGLVQAGTATLGGAVNFSEFEADGTLVFHGAASVWRDLIFSASNLRGGASPPSFAVFSGGVYGFRFDDGTTDELHGAFELQHDYLQGSALSYHVHWSPTTTNTGNCRWGLEYTIVNSSGVFSAPTTIYAVQAGAGVVDTHQLLAFSDIAGTGLQIGAVMVFRIFRDGTNGADTFTGNAFLHSVGVHYEIDTVGSRARTTK